MIGVILFQQQFRFSLQKIHHTTFKHEGGEPWVSFITDYYCYDIWMDIGYYGSNYAVKAKIGGDKFIIPKNVFCYVNVRKTKNETHANGRQYIICDGYRF